MYIHNLMEDLVKHTVNELFETVRVNRDPDWCTCSQCKMDVVCYVLNRLKPEYVVSSRGIAYTDHDYGERLQLKADITSMAREGWSRIDSAKRPNHAHENGEADSEVKTSKGPMFNLPPIMGRVFNGLNFEPIYGATVSLFMGDELIRMIDSNWQNPYQIVKNTAGTFTFWPKPIAAEKSGEKMIGSMRVRIELPEFETLNHYCEMEIISEEEGSNRFSMQSMHRLPDLYMFKR